MKIIDGDLILVDEKTEEYIDAPYYQLEDGRRVLIDHVYVADHRDIEGQHEGVEKAAKDGKGCVVSITAGDDNYHFCNEKRIFKPRKKR